MTFSVSVPTPAFTVSSTGAISAPDTLAVGTYTASGTDSDSCSTAGNWTYSLTVHPHTVNQSAPSRVLSPRAIPSPTSSPPPTE